MNITISIIILLAYTIFACAYGRKIPRSLSTSVYMLPAWGRPVWTVVLVAIAFLTVPSFIDATADSFRAFAFAACAALAFVAISPLTVKSKMGMSFAVHSWGAVICGLSSQLAIAFSAPLYLLCWLPFIGYFVYVKANHLTFQTALFWAEMTCFAATFLFCAI